LPEELVEAPWHQHPQQQHSQQQRQQQQQQVQEQLGVAAPVRPPSLVAVPPQHRLLKAVLLASASLAWQQWRGVEEQQRVPPVWQQLLGLRTDGVHVHAHIQHHTVPGGCGAAAGHTAAGAAAAAVAHLLNHHAAHPLQKLHEVVAAAAAAPVVLAAAAAAAAAVAVLQVALGVVEGGWGVVEVKGDQVVEGDPGAGSCCCCCCLLAIAASTALGG